MNRILLAEDDTGTRKLIKNAFAENRASTGWNILEASDEEQALDIISSQRVRLVITDLATPNMDGRELVRKIKSHGNYKNLPIIVLGGEKRLETDLLKLGAVDFYHKPITDYKPFIAKVKTHMDNLTDVAELKRPLPFSRINHDLENIRETMQQCIKNFCLQMHADFGFLISPNDSGRLERYASFHIPEHITDRLSAFLADCQNPLVAELTATREPVSIKSVCDFVNYPEYTEIARQCGISSLLLLPLKRANRQTGIMAFFFRKPRSYQKELMESLSTSVSETLYAVADAQQLKLLKNRIHNLWRENRLPLKTLKLPMCCNGNCAEDCEECSLSREFKIESAQDILMLTSGLINKVANNDKQKQRQANNLELMVAQRTKELEEKRIKAQETSKLKSEFLASMSHELRSPLNSIIGFAERIPSKIDRVYYDLDRLTSTLNGDLPANLSQSILSTLTSMRNKELHTVNEFCGYISNSGSHLLGLINDILDLSRIEAGKLELAVESIDFRPNVASIIASFSNAAEEKKLALTSDIDNLPTHTIMVDKQRFNQILFNLVGNAVKFSNSNGAVGLTTKELPGENMMEFCISDNGPGIRSDFQKHIFNRFEQADGSGILPGAGLGLAITKKLVELLGGSIWFESEPGRGSRFYFTVPTGSLCGSG